MWDVLLRPRNVAMTCKSSLQEKVKSEVDGGGKEQPKIMSKKHKAATRLLELIIYRSLLPTLYSGFKAACWILTYNFQNNIRGICRLVHSA